MELTHGLSHWLDPQANRASVAFVGAAIRSVYRTQEFKLEGILTMKEIKAIGQPFFLLKVIERLRSAQGQLSVTVSEILDFGGLSPVRTSQADGDFVKKWKLEVIVPDSACQSVIETIHDCAQSENGAGTECFVSEITEVVRGDTASQFHGDAEKLR